MKTLSMALAVMLFSPLAAQAETVFNDTQSFQIAKVVKLGWEGGSGVSISSTDADLAGGASASGSHNITCSESQFRATAKSSNTAGGYVCITCSGGETCGGKDSGYKFKCQAGYERRSDSYKNGTGVELGYGNEYCTQCNPGTYKANDDSSYSNLPKCTDCANGKYHNAYAQTSCNVQSDPGYCTSKDGTSCLDGTNTSGASKGAKFQVACPKGKYQGSAGKSFCYDNVGAGECTSTNGTSCIDGSNSSGTSTGATQKINCPEGYYQGNSGKTFCSQANKGQCTSTDGSSCIGSGKTKATKVISCPKGKYQGSAGRSYCDDCSASNYPANDNGNYVSSGATKCLPIADTIQCETGYDKICDTFDGVYFCTCSKSFI